MSLKIKILSVDEVKKDFKYQGSLYFMFEILKVERHPPQKLSLIRPPVGSSYTFSFEGLEKRQLKFLLFDDKMHHDYCLFSLKDFFGVEGGVVRKIKTKIGIFVFEFKYITKLDENIENISDFLSNDKKFMKYFFHNEETKSIKKEIYNLIFLHEINQPLPKDKITVICNKIRIISNNLLKRKEFLLQKKDVTNSDKQEKELISLKYKCSNDLYEKLNELRGILKIYENVGTIDFSKSKKHHKTLKRKVHKFEKLSSIGTSMAGTLKKGQFKKPKEFGKYDDTTGFIKKFDNTFTKEEFETVNKAKEEKAKIIVGFEELKKQKSEELYKNIKEKFKSEVVYMVDKINEIDIEGAKNIISDDSPPIEEEEQPKSKSKSKSKKRKSKRKLNEEKLKKIQKILKKIYNLKIPDMLNVFLEETTNKIKFYQKSNIIVLLKVLEKIVRLIYFEKFEDVNTKTVYEIFSLDFHKKLHKSEEKIINKYVSKLNLSEIEKKLLILYTLINNYRNEKKFLVYVKKKIREIDVELKAEKKKKKFYENEVNIMNLIEAFKEIKFIFFQHVNMRMTQISLCFTEDPSCIRTVLKCLSGFAELSATVSEITKEKQTESDKVFLKIVPQETVKNWVQKCANLSFHFHYNDIKTQLCKETQLEQNLLESAVLIKVCEKIKDDVKYYKSSKIGKYFIKNKIDTKFYVVLCEEYKELLFQNVLQFVSAVSKEKNDNFVLMKKKVKKLSQIEDKFDSSLEMFRRLTTTFESTWKFFEEFLKGEKDKGYQYYSIFYQVINSTIQQNTKLRLLKWIDKAIKLDNYRPINDEILHSMSCKNILEILFEPLEIIYEIDQTINATKKNPQKSLVYVYFENVHNTLIKYIDILSRKIRTEKNDQSKYTLINNIQGTIQQVKTYLNDNDTAEAIIDLPSGGEFNSDRIKSIFDIPIIKKLIKDLQIRRNQVSANISKRIFNQSCNTFFKIISSKDDTSELIEKLYDELNQKSFDLSEKVYIGIVEKVLEYLYLLFINEIIDRILNKNQNLFLIKRNLENFLKRINDLLYCDGHGLPLQTMSNYSERLKTIMNLYLHKDIDYLIDLYKEIEHQNVPDKKLNYYVCLIGNLDDDFDEVNPKHVYKIIEKVSKMFKDEKGLRFIKSIETKQKLLKDLEEKKLKEKRKSEKKEKRKSAKKRNSNKKRFTKKY